MATKKQSADKKAEATIYALCCPDTGEIRYIGKANNPAARLKSHIRDSRRRKTPVYSWIRKLSDRNVLPTMKILEVAEDWREAEVRLIAQHKPSGRLLNLADGGDEPICSTEQRAKNGRAVALAIHSDPIRHRLWELKRQMLINLKFFQKRGDTEIVERMKARMREIAAKRPKNCGEWAHI